MKKTCLIIFVIILITTLFFYKTRHTSSAVKDYTDNHFSKESRTHISTKSDVKGVLLLITDYRSYFPTQIIQISNSTLKHGFATVVYPFEEISKEDIFWEEAYILDGQSYPIIVKKINEQKSNRINRIIEEIKDSVFEDPCSFTDDYQYVLYFDGHKIASIHTRSLESGKLSYKLKDILNEIILAAKPLYPNYGLWQLE